MSPRSPTLMALLRELVAIAHAEATVFGPAAAAILSLVGLTYSASVAGFMVARFALGIGEAGNFPAAIKATAEWFPKRERALATGIFNSGTNVGALATPLVVPWITLTWGWYWAFVATGLIGFLWLAAWWPLYRHPDEHPRLTAAERAYILVDHTKFGRLTPIRIPEAERAAALILDREPPTMMADSLSRRGLHTIVASA